MNKMKFSPIGKLLFACAMVVLLGGCTDKVTETVYVDLSLSRYSVAFPVEGGTTSITVATEDSWGANTDASWLTLSYEGDSKLVIMAEANVDTESVREAEITISTTSCGSATVQVRQEPATAPSLSVNTGSANAPIDSEGGTFTVTVKCNCDWTASLAEAIPNWELSYDVSTGIVSVTAGANSGDAITGTIVITAGTLTEEVGVTQSSRAENPYFQFEGYWNVYSSDCLFGQEWLGEGVNCNVTLAGYSYPNIMSFINWGDSTGLSNDNLSYYADERKLKMPLGYLAGTVSYWYLYFVAFNEAMSSYSTGTDEQPYLELILGDDGSVTISNYPDDYPILGYVGTYGYGYSYFSDLRYCKAPFTLTKSDSGSPASIGELSFGPVISPVTDLPDGIPARLPLGMTGEVSETLAF